MQDNDVNPKASKTGKGDSPDVRFDIHQQAKVVSGEMDGVRAEEISTINGDIVFQLFAQASVLSRHIRVREFQTLVAERTKRFVGRDFIFNAIDDFLKDPTFPSGYIVISGEPGIGKTALMAQWVKQRGYVHHFNISTQNIRSTSDFLANVCAQLIVRYDLEHFTLPPEATKDSGFLSRLLAEVVEKKGVQPVVILVDALDEVDDRELPPDENRLCLPWALPDGVFCVVTKREEYDDRLFIDRREDIYLRDDDPHNLDDVRQYIQNFITTHRAQMTARIKQWGVPEDEFVAVITEKSQGNFMYLVHVLRDIRDAKITTDNMDDIRKLPRGLHAYYQRHWRMMQAQDTERFEKYYEPVVCILATVREPVTVDMVSEWTNLPAKRVKEVIEVWREFLNVEDAEATEPRYRVYHTSFQDFLEEEVE